MHLLQQQILMLYLDLQAKLINRELNHTIPGDFNLVSENEVLSLAGGNASGRVQR